MPDNVYWPTLTGNDLAAAVMRRFEEFEEALKDRDLDRMKVATWTYYGQDEQGHESHRVSREGSKDQVRVVLDNEFRSVVTNKLTIAMSEPPGFLPVPVNTDSDSQATSLLTRGVVDYYFDEGKLDRTTRQATEMAEVLGWAWVDVPWNEEAGPVAQKMARMGSAPSPTPEPSVPAAEAMGPEEPVETDPGMPAPRPMVGVQTIRAGDVEGAALLPSEVGFNYDARDVSPYLIVRRWRNRWDLAARVAAKPPPGLAPRDLEALLERIRTMTYDRKREEVAAALRGWNDETSRRATEDEIPVYELRHLPTPACPQGRWAVVLAADLILEEGPSKYGDDLGVYRIAAAERFGTPRAYTSAHDMLGLQRAVDALTSIMYSNPGALGLNIIVSREGSEIRPVQLAEGLTHIEYSGGEENKPESLSLANTPKEVPASRSAFKADMASKAGMDNLSMGREERDLSGAAMALLDSRTQRAVSALASANTQLRQDVANALIRRFKMFGRYSRKLPLLVGKYKRPMLGSFDKTAFDGIDRVRVETVSPLMRSPAGRLEMANVLIEAKKAGVEPELVLSVVETGKYEPLTEAPMAARTTVREENERLLAGEALEQPGAIDPVTGQPGPGGLRTAVFTDNPLVHIQEHATVLATLAARRDPNIVANTRAHMEVHLGDLMAWVSGDPMLVAIHGQPPPIPMPGMTAPPAPGEESGTAPPKPGAQTVTPPPVGGPGGPQMPTNPATGEKYSPTGDVANA